MSGRSRLVGAALLLAATTAGCASHPAPSLPPAPASTPTPADAEASTAAWVDRCVQQVRYWAGELRAYPDHSYDYQEMGLSGATYAALQEVVADQPASGWDPQALTRQAREACTSRVPQPASASQQGWP